MEFKNVTSYKNFKKILEASIPSEFANKTGFAESLVGRGLFSIIRYFKQGIDLGRLEYLKRKLENEYFAGWLRFCALKKINIKEGTLPEQMTDQPSNQQQFTQTDQQQTNVTQTELSDSEQYICGVFMNDHLTMNKLPSMRNEVQNYINDLEDILHNTQDPIVITEVEDLINYTKNGLKYINIKNDIVLNVFAPLNQIATASGMTFDDNNQNIILTKLDKLIEFLNGDAKACSDYKLTQAEKEVINKLSTSTNSLVKNKIDQILDLIKESYNYNKSEKLNEELIGGSINPHIPIMQILGDELNIGQTSTKVKPYEYLESIGVNNVDDINFKACAYLWSKNPTFKDEVAKLVSIEGIRKIQYAASRIIYRVKKTPTYTGITPEKGGGVDKTEDSALRTAWERKIEKCKGEWVYFINIDKNNLDPFRAVSLQDAYRTGTGNAEFERFSTNVNIATNPIIDSANVDELGLSVITRSPMTTENEYFIMQVYYENDTKLAYLLFSLKSVNGGAPNIYQYYGNININKIIADKLYENPNFKRDLARNHAASILDPNEHSSQGCVDLHNYLGFNFNNITSGAQTFYPYGYFYGKIANFERYSTVSSPTTQKSVFMHIYMDSNVLTTQRIFSSLNTANPDINSIKIYNSDGNNNRKEQNLGNVIKMSNDILNWKIGSVYKFKDDSWAMAYFPNWDDIKNYRNKIKYPNETEFQGKIKLI